MGTFFDELINAINYFDSMTVEVKISFLNFVCCYILSHDEMNDTIINNLEMILTMTGFMNELHDLEIFRLTISILQKIKEKYEIDGAYDIFPLYIDVITLLYDFINCTNNDDFFEGDLCLNFLTFVDDNNLLKQM